GDLSEVLGAKTGRREAREAGAREAGEAPRAVRHEGLSGWTPSLVSGGGTPSLVSGGGTLSGVPAPEPSRKGKGRGGRYPIGRGDICPICGEPISWVTTKYVTDRYGKRYDYLVAVHYYGYENGRKKVRRCHLGPPERYRQIGRTLGAEVLGIGYGAESVRRLVENARGQVERALEICEELGERRPAECEIARRAAEALGIGGRAVTDQIGL
ncbi:MAG: hypothetical protein QXU64_02130, partial [Thermofilaceae archaeon]